MSIYSGKSVGETYSLEGTLGQAEAGYQMTGGEYSLAGGFWGAGGAALPPEWELYLPLVVNQG